jgi:hypothetical protein
VCNASNQTGNLADRTFACTGKVTYGCPRTWLWLRAGGELSHQSGQHKLHGSPHRRLKPQEKTMRGDKRRKIWIDSFQTALSIRIALYFLCYQATVVVVYTIWNAMQAELGQGIGEASQPFTMLPLGLLAAIAVLFIRDAVHFSHRIVGPVYRFRKAVLAVTNGEELELLQLRQGDYLQELKDELNTMLRALEQHGAVRLKEPAAIKSDTAQIPA